MTIPVVRSRSRYVVCSVLGIVSLGAVGCSSDETAVPVVTEPAASATVSTVPSSPAEPDQWLDTEQRRRIDQLISTFENSTTEIDYAYAANIGDGRGVTAGRAGFTTATCDAAQVVRTYSEKVPENGLAGFLPELDRLCDADSDDTSGLPEADYIAAWTAAASDDAFRAAQDAVVDAEYYVPAMTIADQIGLRNVVSRAELYDTALQHGVGDDPDGLPSLVARTTDRVGTPEAAGEAAWLDTFFDVRIDDLTNPANEATAEQWRESTDRVECLRTVADNGNSNLDGPVTCTVYGDEFTVR